MCNFVIRPIKSYATVNVTVGDGDDAISLNRGDFVDVERTTEHGVVGKINGDPGHYIAIPFDVFVHSFTANPDDIEKVRKEEYKTMGYDPKKNDKK